MSKKQEKISRGSDRQTVMTKKGCQFFSKKIGVTPSVAAPGDTNPSDATVKARMDNSSIFLNKLVGQHGTITDTKTTEIIYLQISDGFDNDCCLIRT